MKRREEEKQKRQEVAQSIRRTRRRSSTLALEYQVRFEEGQDTVTKLNLQQHKSFGQGQETFAMLSPDETRGSESSCFFKLRKRGHVRNPETLWEKTHEKIEGLVS